MDKRPLVWIVAMFALGIVIAGHVQVPWYAPPAVLLLTLLVFMAVVRRLKNARLFLLFFAFVAAGMAVTNARYAANANDPLARSLQRGDVLRADVVGSVRKVALVRSHMDFADLTMDVHSVETDSRRLDVPGRARLRWSKPVAGILPGDIVRVTGYLEPLDAATNEGLGTSIDEYHRWGIWTNLDAKGPGAVQRLGPGPWWSPTRLAARIRLWQADRLTEVLPPTIRGFVFAVWLGDRDAIDRDEREQYRRTGTAHILAVSGLHVGVFFVSAAFAINMVMRRSWVRTVVTLAVVALFVLMTGARTSALRAGLMVGLFLAAEFFDRERDAPTALSLAALVMLLWNPLQLFGPSFQLSFACVASLLIFAEPLAEVFKRFLPHPVNRALAAAIAVQILAVPITAYHFRAFTSFTPLVNIIVVPLLAVALWLCFFTSLAALLSASVALPFGYALWPVVSLLRDTAELFDAWWNPDLVHVRPAMAAAICYYAVAALLPRTLAPTPSSRVPNRALLVAVLLLAAAVPVLWNARLSHAGVSFLDVGHGDATLVRTPEGKTILIDGGECDEYRRRGKDVVAPFLEARGIRRLDCVVVSHADRDHIGGLTHIVENFPVECVVRPPGHDDVPLMREFIALCDERGVPVRTVWRGHQLDLGDATFEVLHPPSADWADRHSVNDASLVLRLDWEGPRVLFTGDIELLGERELARGDCAAEVLKVPHHGSTTSSSERFLRHVNPALAAISAGMVSRRSDVDPGVVARYDERGVPVRRTDRGGSIDLVWRKDGSGGVCFVEERPRPRRGTPWLSARH
ncbi:MAG: DNA internalization-related competence protein ComEC/Rec2 [bacterium]|nr:DNA internalization-related competence protein ComEC/Rec2 [bacterium]